MKPLLRWFLANVCLATLLFGSAGRLDLPMAWAYISLYGIFSLAAILRADPGLLEERIHPGPASRDRPFRHLVLLLVLSHFALAGLDAGRFHWSDTVPTVLKVAGLFGLAAAFGLAGWASAVNPFFSSVIRIQRERGHHLITAGPYQYIRHPGYAAAIVAALCSGLALGSWLSMVPSFAGIMLLIRHTAVEDEFLRHELQGYSEYATRILYRLVPGLW